MPVWISSSTGEIEQETWSKDGEGFASAPGKIAGSNVQGRSNELVVQLLPHSASATQSGLGEEERTLARTMGLFVTVYSFVGRATTGLLYSCQAQV
jgi:hypothetical protein